MHSGKYTESEVRSYWRSLSAVIVRMAQPWSKHSQYHCSLYSFSLPRLVGAVGVAYIPMR